ncbi:MAG: HAD family phosphatase [Lachnospiraceae bacterium]|nr:HAD family phosphatase [Lachnospiraceae bacterium]
MIKNVVFDIGNVLADFRWREFLQDKGFDEAMITRIAKASALSPYWDEFDRGAWDEEKTIAAFISLDPGIEKELHMAYDDVTDMVRPRAYAIPWVQELRRQGYGVYYLSNFSKKAYDECRHALGFMDYCDGGILSYRELIVKPNPEIYHRLTDRYGLDPSECVFFDDTQKNVDGAIACGWKAFLFTTKEQAVRDLESLK